MYLKKIFPEVRLITGLPVKIFECVAYVHNPVHKKNKWSTEALKGGCLGYLNTQKGFKVYHPITRKYMVSKDVIFDEKTFYYRTTGSNNLRDIPLIIPSIENTVQEGESEPVIAEIFMIPLIFISKNLITIQEEKKMYKRKQMQRNLRMY